MRGERQTEMEAESQRGPRGSSCTPTSFGPGGVTLGLTASGSASLGSWGWWGSVPGRLLWGPLHLGEVPQRLGLLQRSSCSPQCPCAADAGLCALFQLPLDGPLPHPVRACRLRKADVPAPSIQEDERPATAAALGPCALPGSHALRLHRSTLAPSSPSWNCASLTPASFLLGAIQDISGVL